MLWFYKYFLLLLIVYSCYNSVLCVCTCTGMLHMPMACIWCPQLLPHGSQGLASASRSPWWALSDPFPLQNYTISLECVCVHMNHYIYLFSLHTYKRTCAVTRLWTSQDSFQESAPSIYHVSLGDQLGLGNKSLYPPNHLSSLNTF